MGVFSHELGTISGPDSQTYALSHVAGDCQRQTCGNTQFGLGRGVMPGQSVQEAGQRRHQHTYSVAANSPDSERLESHTDSFHTDFVPGGWQGKVS